MAEQATPEKGQCSCCFEARVAQGQPPRDLVKLAATTSGFNKRKQPLSVHVCVFCDGPPREPA